MMRGITSIFTPLAGLALSACSSAPVPERTKPYCIEVPETARNASTILPNILTDKTRVFAVVRDVPGAASETWYQGTLHGLDGKNFTGAVRPSPYYHDRSWPVVLTAFVGKGTCVVETGAFIKDYQRFELKR